ncbi:MAG: hypothetical protein ACJ72N_00440 [Labedaea sp.]
MTSRTTPPTTAPHRLTLSAAEYAYLAGRLALRMPPGWEPEPNAEAGAVPAELAERGVLRGDGDLLAVHPSVAMNLQILARPQVMLDTTTTIGTEGRHGLHALAGPLGASLFALADGGVELSLFAATDLGRELARAVVSAEDTGILAILGHGEAAEPPAGTVPLAALHELGVAELLRDADPDASAEVLAGLALSPEEAALAKRVTERTDGGLVCLVTVRMADGLPDSLSDGLSDADTVRAARVTWLHTDAGWSGIRPEPDPAGRRLVRLEPVDRTDLGVWVAPYVAEALSNG